MAESRMVEFLKRHKTHKAETQKVETSLDRKIDEIGTKTGLFEGIFLWPGPF
jgi:hypothetical protein